MGSPYERARTDRLPNPLGPALMMGAEAFGSFQGAINGGHGGENHG
jgi:hypothetical protein